MYCGPMTELFVDYSRGTMYMYVFSWSGWCVYLPCVCSMAHKFVFSHICAQRERERERESVCVCVCDQKMSAYKVIEVIQMM